MTPGHAPSWPEVRAIEAHLSAVFGATVRAKADDPFMRLLALGLDAIAAKLPPGVLPMTGAAFLHAWAMTLGMTIYMPAVTDPAVYLFLLLHEIGHVVSSDGTSGDATSASDPYAMPAGLAYVQLYATGDLRDLRTLREFCATAEAHAEAVRVEGVHLFTGHAESVEEALQPLHGPAYLLRDADVDLARGLLRSRVTSAARGVYLSPVTHTLRTFCQRTAPHLLAA